MDLKKLRKTAGFSRETLAEKIGCHKQQIYNFENGRATIPLKYVKSMSKVLNIPKDELTDFILKNRIEKMLKKV